MNPEALLSLNDGRPCQPIQAFHLDNQQFKWRTYYIFTSNSSSANLNRWTKMDSSDGGLTAPARQQRLQVMFMLGALNNVGQNKKRKVDCGQHLFIYLFAFICLSYEYCITQPSIIYCGILGGFDGSNHNVGFKLLSNSST